jgi:FkbM family methyltransferase
VFHLDNITEKKALVCNRYDKIEIDFLENHLKKRDNAIFVDVGANSGLYSIYLASKMNAGSRVLALEPNPRMCERISKNAQLLQLYKMAIDIDIAIEQCCVGLSFEEVYLDLSKGVGSANVVIAPTCNSIAVQSKPILDILRYRSISTIDAIKIDVGGFEDRVLMPLICRSPLLAPKVLVFEYVHSGNWEFDLIEKCISFGYNEILRTRSSCLMIRE